MAPRITVMMRVQNTGYYLRLAVESSAAQTCADFVVILSNVLEHLEGRPAFLRQVQEVARPSRFLIRVPVFERHWSVPLKRELGVEWRLDFTHETEYTLEPFADEMVKAGLRVTHQEVRWGEIWAEAVPDAS